MTPNPSIDFGYPWWLSYGHLAILLPSLVGLVAGWLRKWPAWLISLFGLLAAWAAISLTIVGSFNVNGVAALPTQSFLRSGTGRVLDLGAGTGRSSIMVLSARPQATLVALDLFSESFERHFGKGGTPQDRLRANLKAAGVDQRASIETGDMRKLPFQAASFDAIVSAYALDHLGRDGSIQALAEASRVLKPGGDFLLMLVATDHRTLFAYPLLSHGATRGATWWKDRAREAGFQVLEEGTTPATLYLLLNREGAHAATKTQYDIR